MNLREIAALGAHVALAVCVGSHGAALAAPNTLTPPGPLEASLLPSNTPGLQRLQLEAPLGGLTQVSLTGQGQALRIDLRRQSRADIDALVQRLRQENALVRSARAVFLPNEEAYIWVELGTAYELVDQSIVAAAPGRSRWELVMSPSKSGLAGTAVELRELRMATRDDLLDIHLAGSAELMAEVSVLDQPARLVVDLPGATPASVERLATGFRAGPVPLFARVAASTQAGIPRLEFLLLENVDLVDSAGEVRDGQGHIRLSLAADRTVAQTRVGGAAEPRLSAIHASVDKGRLELSLPDVPSARIQSYTLEDPARLVVDLLGWRPEQVHEAAARFTTPHPGLAGLRLESTRLGSARLIFDLAGRAPLLTHGAAGDTRYALSLRLPAVSGSPANAQGPRNATSYALRGERLGPRTPLLVVRPLMLTQGADMPALAASEKNTALLAVYREALNQDPKYQAAKADFEIASQAVPQARAGLLPSASLDYQKSTIHQDVSRASNPSFPTGATRYPSANLSLTITQPLLRAPAALKLSQAGVSVEQARFNLLAAEQDLILRVASSVLNVMAGNDGLELARAEREATERQYELAKARKTTGLGNVTQLFDAEARASQARAREREARNRLDDARLGVKEILGEDLPALGGFKGDFAPTEPMPAEVGPWVNAALDQNLALQARRLAVQISDLEVKRQQAAYAPSVNLVASTSRQDTGGSLFGNGQRYNNTELGVRVNIPLFEGGMTTSLVRESVARREKAVNEQEQELRRSERLARGAFNGVLASLDSVEALRKAVLAQQSALEAREEGLKAGLFTPVQVMDAYRLFYTAKRDFLQARYDYLINRLKLKQAVGILAQHDLDDLSALLQPL